MLRFKEYEDAVQHLKEQLSEAQNDRERTSDFDRERRRLNRTIEERESEIARLKSQIDDMNEKNINMQDSETTLKMELERKDVRFNQLKNIV